MKLSGKAGDIVGILLMVVILGSIYLFANYSTHPFISRPTSSSHPVAATPQPPAPPKCEVNADKLLSLVNQQRSSMGLAPLRVDPVLVASSKTKLTDMVTNAYYGHDMKDGQPWYSVIDRNVVKAPISEDLGAEDHTPEQSWAEFKASPSHYASFTNSNYTRIGISTQCTDYTVSVETGPTKDGTALGKKLTDVTVAHLAGDEPAPVRYRTGAICADGTYSGATGSGACSWHGGVDHWVYN